MKKMLGVVLALALAGTGGLAAQTAEGSFTKDLKVSGPVELKVNTGSGGITVHHGPAGNVHVYAKIRASGNWFFGNGDPSATVREIVANPPVTQTGNVIVIGQQSRSFNNVGITYDLTVPEQTRVNAGTGSGGIEVNGIAGPLDAYTGSGGITADTIGNRVTVRTGSGGIKVSGANGNVDASTGSGGIDVANVKGSVDLRTGSGGITVMGADADVRARSGAGTIRIGRAKGNVEVHAGSGGVEVDGTPKAFKWDLHSSAGSVKVGLPSGTPFEVDAETRGGTVSTSHQVTVSGTTAKNILRGVSGKGDNRLFIRAGSGSIRID